VSVTLTKFVLGMTLHADVVRKAHVELDALVGHDRMPTFTDIKDNR
jgi:hypothetical protein